MIRKITDPVAAGAPEAWVRLRAIRVLVDHGWVGYGGVWRWHRHVIQLPDGAGQRVLDREETFWWALGFADGRQRGADVLAVRDEPVPEIVSLRDLCDEFGENLHTARLMWRNGVLYRLWLKTRSMYVFRAQYVAMLESWALVRGDLSPAQQQRVPQLIEEWVEVQNLIPDLPDPPAEQALVDLSTWKPPAIDVGQAGYARRLQALTTGGTDHQEGWFDYLATDGRTYKVDVPIGRGRVVTRTLPEEAVLPYVLGMGDSHGHGYLVSYQPPPSVD